MSVQDREKEQSFYAHGKLLISGEYMVLNGAMALAVPLSKGQLMKVSPNSSPVFSWTAFSPAGEWFSVNFKNDLSVIDTNDPQKAKTLKNILTRAAAIKNVTPDFFAGKSVTTELEFDPNWGWGSSSTLISNLSNWMEIDPYQLLSRTFGGSGYDLACSNASGPVFYVLSGSTPLHEPTQFNPPFEDQLWVVYLNKKQSSSKAIKEHLKKTQKKSLLIKEISHISRQMSIEKSFENFSKLMIEHESVISGLIGWAPLKEKHFNDFPGAVKSLGAWGGDFFMALSPLSDDETKKYFQTKGLNVLFKIKDIKLDSIK
ncbi:GYDIA family GHMP kinase [Marinilabilia rubra]|uniref:GHMP kinase n=1 Tax=Marinilabilia rubra TaxID=2162893 RepID=A0A2U2B573_9BACT|nr:GYDIA family GHMP kinase [Marinilabilia rubra]PWD98220.1 hypothetical protein DDZ16_16415 [Marinilabilia rubra]